MPAIGAAASRHGSPRQHRPQVQHLI